MHEMGMAPDSINGFIVSLKEDGEAAESRNDLRGALHSVKYHGEKLVKWLDEAEEELELCDIEPEKKIALKLKCSDQVLKHLKAVADIAKAEFDTSQDKYAHQDEIRILINRSLLLTESIYRPKGSDDDWNEWSNGLKDILLGIRMGKK